MAGTDGKPPGRITEVCGGCGVRTAAVTAAAAGDETVTRSAAASSRLALVDRRALVPAGCGVARVSATALEPSPLSVSMA
jgi:hypothetical protein